MSAKTDEILDSLKSLSLLEASELVKQIEEAFGVCNVNIEKIGSLPQWIKKRYSS